ncbi:hypothetical protein Osc7112_1366 [Oscillatoria nigro-viridis PCC 7112]|uniref:Uncharacterized protein n=1 Tax=Phormidium nigroviride PCC 7112 TaxID=179408 RepID=K9VEI0_9CYAN|nr:hypothetical protein Osc7112_1366 [Oscillatoria nigro-viridis PCC 7112]
MLMAVGSGRLSVDNQASRMQAPGFIRPEIKNLYPIEEPPNLSVSSPLKSQISNRLTVASGQLPPGPNQQTL